ncbi:hypothetical protein T4D_13436 [Trichinella pseudospiralis]|uniref:Uncharacterized protein n=1 Tax=Trichinella pseudospiralis TaxID=6337 RepID=A0A0V1FHB0_TRIPS|nr:hypothetical protein T4D_13436 [Trichinella pseudospiralis]
MNKQTNKQTNKQASDTRDSAKLSYVLLEKEARFKQPELAMAKKPEYFPFFTCHLRQVKRDD